MVTTCTWCCALTLTVVVMVMVVMDGATVSMVEALESPAVGTAAKRKTAATDCPFNGTEFIIWGPHGYDTLMKALYQFQDPCITYYVDIIPPVTGKGYPIGGAVLDDIRAHGMVHSASCSSALQHCCWRWC
jgi:hypothetical protein